ncbi:carboxyl transferase domain-containing protein [Micromonospora sp. WMMD975]|uniref:carboxyl transferase domain-containing protein n=1 Tax=Micromonospora sp. WMMD975 TaxID=3016087 RepID=UPI00249A2E9B|nr:carboxyl transferase domain-containing protein [Micromonospora sp. WMMD975]WFE36450.1 carboxyl transferase domain-containing protein [Micromonospora sp. WMMD975]
MGTYPDRVLVANRGEVAVRVLRTLADLAVPSVAVYAADDERCLHVRRADRAVPLPGAGVAAYLDQSALIEAARSVGATALHPGWGFLSENADFASRCADAGLTFVGPAPQVLRVLGDKTAARAAAESAGLPVVPATGPATPPEAMEFLAAAPEGIMLKAVAGGGGRGMRPVTDPAELAAAFERCRSEALGAFGDGTLYAERLLTGRRHIEVQIVGDGTGAATALGDRDCSLQRRRQKVVELAPAPALAPQLRAALHHAAVRLAAGLRYRGVGTVEFLVGADDFVFLEANPRLQVEHTVTEQVFGVDLVEIQLRLAAGADLAAVGLAGPAPEPAGTAIQLRVTTETVRADGGSLPATGVLTAFDPPAGRGVRTDTHGYAGYRVGAGYDSMLAKVVVHEPGGDPAVLRRRASRALAEFRVEGVDTNLGVLARLLAHPEATDGSATTAFLDEHAAELAAAPDVEPLWFPGVDVDPLAAAEPEPDDGTLAVRTPMEATVIAVPAGEGDRVTATSVLVVLEAMKMEHQVEAGVSGVVDRLPVTVGQTVRAGTLLASLVVADATATTEETAAESDPDLIRPDLRRVLDRQRKTRDEARPDAVAKRHDRGHRTARENLADLCDPGSFTEYGSLVLAGQRARRSLDDLIDRTPADGLVAGVGQINRTGCVVMAYDYTVLAGTQGYNGHRKKDRLFELAERHRWPVVMFAEGGGGRPGDTENPGVANLDTRAFALLARLSGLVPTVSVVTGRCFAGNAALVACSDFIVATPDANIGMAGPAMIEGGGLGVYRPEEIGPTSVHAANGVVDLVVPDDAAAVRATRRYLSYFQGRTEDWEAPDQRPLRHAVPENRRRTYDVRAVLDTLADRDSVLELRREHGVGMITALVRIAGRPVGLIANNPRHLGGAIDAEGGSKAARFMELCDAFDLPIVSLCDTPGFMVGPAAEESAQVRHFGRMFLAGASLTVPMVTVVLRKGYGLGAQAMARGGFYEPELTLSWPTGEFGGMGLEGAVRLGFRKELDAVTDPGEREALYQRLVAQMYERGSALNIASVFEVDDVIDPAQTRARITGVLDAAPPPAPRAGKKRPLVPAW